MGTCIYIIFTYNKLYPNLEYVTTETFTKKALLQILNNIYKMITITPRY